MGWLTCTAHVGDGIAPVVLTAEMRGMNGHHRLDRGAVDLRDFQRDALVCPWLVAMAIGTPLMPSSCRYRSPIARCYRGYRLRPGRRSSWPGWVPDGTSIRKVVACPGTEHQQLAKLAPHVHDLAADPACHIPPLKSKEPTTVIALAEERGIGQPVRDIVRLVLHPGRDNYDRRDAQAHETSGQDHPIGRHGAVFIRKKTCLFATLDGSAIQSWIDG